MQNSNAYQQSMQVWILSKYGKPIFSSCGNENELSDKFGLVQTLIMRYENWKDSLLSIQMKELFIRFYHKDPLILCIISKQPFNLSVQLDIVYNQVLSILTKFSLDNIYTRQGYNYDLRNVLGTVNDRKRIDACMEGFNADPVVFLSGFRILPLTVAYREFLHNVMRDTINRNGAENVIFGLLVVHRQLITLVRKKNFDLKAMDFNIILNLIECHASQIGEHEHFIQICLPHFNSDAMLNSYISYLWEGKGPCLILLSNISFKKADAFEERSRIRNIRTQLEEAIHNYSNETQLKNSLLHPESTIKMETSDLWHFMYKSYPSCQICCSSPQKPWITPEEITILNNGYYKLSSIMRRGNKMKRFFFQLETFSLFSWLTQNFELHCTFSPLATQKTATFIADQIIRTLRNDERRVFFMLQAGVLNDFD